MHGAIEKNLCTLIKRHIVLELYFISAFLPSNISSLREAQCFIHICAVNTQYVLNKCPNNKVNNKACEQSSIVLQGVFIYIMEVSPQNNPV